MDKENFTTKGYKHSNETKKKMSENHADFTGENNPFKNSIKDPLKREEHRKRCQKTWSKRNKEWRNKFSKKLSKSLAEAHRNNVNFHKHHKSGFHTSTKTGKEHFYRSSWEERVCEYLDSAENVVTYASEPFIIHYKDSTNNDRWTRIDFEVIMSDGRILIIEVKPSSLVPRAKYKLIGYQNYCDTHDNHKFVLITEKELECLENWIV